MNPPNIVALLLLAVSLMLGALACALGPVKRGSKHFFVAVVLSFFGVILPLAVFLLSCLMVPEWKGSCKHGWIDCFHATKAALTPLVLWASISLYAADICKIRPTPFMAMGTLIGAIVSSVCFVFGIITSDIYAPGLNTSFIQAFSQSLAENRLLLWLLVPLSTAVWYCARAGQLVLEVKVKPLTYLWTATCSLPFWIWSVVWCRKMYLSLPDTAPLGCFIVTAAAKGHRGIVGPLITVSRRGRIQTANAQLLIFWQFETLWRKRAPSSHAKFRRFYNCFGPRLARRINSPWLADATYLALKPAEIMARVVLSSWVREPSQTPHCQVWIY